ncbi:sensor histidine kinase [Lentisalinibacter salinarum]|uniref:sensor histidine kinase n=1 Tax=Lentisalinibacter salinarum TaxID=2992239 RepID=UPI00386B3140
MLAAWAIAVHLLISAIDNRLDARLENATATLANATFPFSADLIARLDRLLDARIALLDPAARTALNTGGAEADAALDRIRSRRDEIDPETVTFFHFDGDNERWRVAVRRLSPGLDDRYAYVAAAAPLTATRNVARESAVLLAAAMFTAMALVAAIAAFFMRSVTRPVTDLANMADRIADGERGISTDIRESNEIGVLASALNRLSSRLGEYEADLANQSRLSALGELASRMAHELRNPLTAIKMQLQLLEERSEGAERARLGGILDEIRRLELIVNSSLAIGGPDSLNPAPADPGRLIGEVISMVGPSLEHRNIELDTVTGRMPRVPIDADRMKQVLLNLLNNAAEELKAGGRILVSAGLSDEYTAFIAVEDSGPGLSASPDPSGSRKPLGLGLGLKISREIVERHGGTLDHGASDKLGGAKFTITLPLSIMGRDRNGSS